MKFDIIVGGFSVGIFASKVEADAEYTSSRGSHLNKKMFSIDDMGQRRLCACDSGRGFPLKDVAIFKE